MESETCLVCGKALKMHDRIKGRCRKCHMREWHAARKELRSKQARKRYAEDPTKQKARSLRKKYGLTLSDVAKMRERQKGCCLACLKFVPEGTPRGLCIDHDNRTGKVRGLLCDNCNKALGLVYENKATLRRLMSYLDYDRSKSLIYLIGSLRNPLVPSVAKQLRERGFEIFDEWYAAGEKADDAWQAYETARGHNFAEALKGKPAENVFLFDRSWIDLSDCAVLVMPGGRSAHLECGYFVGCGKPVFILSLEEPDRFDVMPNFVTGIARSVEELVVLIRQEFEARNLPLPIDNALLKRDTQPMSMSGCRLPSGSTPFEIVSDGGRPRSY